MRKVNEEMDLYNIMCAKKIWGLFGYANRNYPILALLEYLAELLNVVFEVTWPPPPQQ